MNVSIRIMGDAELAEKVADIIVSALESAGLTVTSPREYPMFRDKKKRDEIDPSRKRIYINVKG